MGGSAHAVGGLCPRQAKRALARRGIPARPDPTHNPPQHEEARDPEARRYVVKLFNIK